MKTPPSIPPADAIPPADQEVRDRILASRDRSLSVEAGAGTGKTTLLVDRVLALLRRGHLLRRLAIITFTRKAAADLSRKLRHELTLNAEVPALRQALNELEHASIGTTDAFCRSLLSDFAIEAGIPPGFAVADDIAQQVLSRRAWDRLLSKSLPSHFETASLLREAGVTLVDLRKIAEIAVSNRDLPLAKIDAPGARPLLPRIREAVDALVDLGKHCRNSQDKLFLRIQDLDRRVREAEAIGGAGAERHLLATRESMRITANAGRAEIWGANAKDLVFAKLQEIDGLLESAVRERGARAAAAARQWIGEFEREYERIKLERGILDFRDLALRTRNLLRDREDIRTKLAARFDEILLDEAQDTDPLQMEIAFLLAARVPDRHSPIDSTLEPGRLFLVGDPKQSIYRFRRADIELYEHARHRFAEAGGAETIQVNFRSQPALLDFVNRVFRGWMVPAEGETIQARYVDLLPGRKPAGEDVQRIHAIVPDPRLAEETLAKSGRPALNAAVVRDVEIDALPRAIRAILGRDGTSAPWTITDPATKKPRAARPGDIAVLVRRIERGDAIRHALQDCGIPALVAVGKRFAAREEIATLSIVLRAVANPEDRFARFSALRSPAFGIEDDALALHTLGTLDPAHPRAPAIARATAVLDELAARAVSLPVPELLERIVEDLSLLSFFGLRSDGKVRADALRLLIEAADSLEDAGFTTLRDFSDWLSAQESETQTEGPGELEDEEERAVQIVTMHKSKGLEFPIVVLADLGADLRTQDSVVARRSEGFLEARFSRDSSVETSGFKEAFDQEDARRKAEDIRLLYVAMTRARDFLLLSWMPVKKGFLASSILEMIVGAEPGRAPSPSSPVAAMCVEHLPPLPEREAIAAIDLDRARRNPPPSSLAAWKKTREQARKGTRILRASTSTPQDRPAPSLDDSPGIQGDLFAVTSFSGAWFGDVIHKALELYDPALENPAGIALAAALDTISGGSPSTTRSRVLQLSDSERGALLHDVDRIVRDPAIAFLWRAKRAKREVPFFLPVDGNFLSGTADAILEQEDGSIVIVDFKTDRHVDAQRSLHHHRDQALLTSYAIAEITRRKVREFRFLFLATDPVTPLSLPITDRELLEARRKLDILCDGTTSANAGEASLDPVLASKA
jgi:ATP-dependent exoDNAse (exonuclease V) beta subunit